MIKGWIRETSRLVHLMAITFIVSACGGGGGGDSGAGFVPVPTPEPQGATIDVTLTDTQGQSITEISPVKQGVFLISVMDPDGPPRHHRRWSRPRQHWGDLCLKAALP